MKKIIIFILALIGLLSFLFFHHKGNELLKPYLATYLEQKLDNNSTVEVQHLKIDMSYFELTALLNNITLIDAKGNYNLLTEHVDVNYTLTYKGFENQKIAFTKAININGNAKGAFDKLNIVGKGQTLESNIDYALTLQNDLINNIKINIQQADLASLLQLTAQPPYTTGKADIHIEIPQFKEMNTHGEATVKLYEAELNEKVFQNEFDINLPSKTRISADIQAKITPKVIKLNGKVNSSLAALDFSKTTINLNNKKLTSEYLLNIPELSKLQFITQQRFIGVMKLSGRITAQDKTYHLTGQTKSFGGKIDFKLLNQQLNGQLSNVPVEKLIYLLAYPQVFKANLNGTFDYHLLNQQGRLNSTLTQAQLLQNNLTELIKQVRGVDLTKERYNKSHFNAEMNHDIIEIDFKAKSKKVLLAIPSGKVNTATNQINANYSININQRDIAGTIQGDTSKPQITIDPSKFIQQEVTELIKDNIDEKKLKDLGIGEKETEVIKNILGDLFK
jgi:hypothetical protein